MPELIVHQLPGAWGLPSISPFCLKLDTYLRMVDIPHRVVVDATPFGAPKRKLPYIEHGGQRIGDSGFIIEYLQREFGCDPDAGLSGEQKAIAHALRRLLEENLYWTLVYDRWMVDRNWQHFRDLVLAGIPLPLRRILGPGIRRGVGRALRGHGIGVHTAAEIHAIGIRDIGALADLLADRPFLMGAEPGEIDATAYGLLANMLLVPIESPVKDEGLRRGNLVAYLDRVKTRYFG
jgi:glutathione S-transferase